MGIYLNPDNAAFKKAVESEIYVDKSLLIAFTNKVLNTLQGNVCVSRPRRFGKSMAAEMLVAYYSRGCDSRELFQNLKIAGHPSFEKHLNKYNVIHLNIQRFMNRTDDIHAMLSMLETKVVRELKRAFSDVEFYEEDLVSILEEIYSQCSARFVFVIDEWDCVFRMRNADWNLQKEYLDFLRDLLKNQPYVALAYMTGILPIKKYGEHSALNMFDEYSMTNADPIAEFTGFTELEVKELCDRYDMDFEETKKWYDGYSLNTYSIYNPKSVVEAMTRQKIDSYWTKTETYESIRTYIDMNYDGLRDTITQMIAGERKVIDTSTFANDMVTFQVQDDVLTLLIHLGYLAYDFDTKEIFILNYEIREQFISTVRVLGWNDVIKSIQLPDELLEATLQGNTDRVSEIIEQVHDENTSILQYNNENSLSCILSLAYYSTRKNYTIHRELAGGKGFADLVFIPRTGCQTPAMIVELKWNISAEAAIDQIKKKQYVKCLKDYTGEILLVGISYDKDAEKRHTCMIEKIQK